MEEQNNQPVQQEVVQPVSQVSSPNSPTFYKRALFYFFGAIIVAGLVGGAYVLGTKQPISQIVQEKVFSPSPSLQIATTPTSFPTLTRDVTFNWKTYTSVTAGYSVKVPSDWKVNQYNNATTMDITPQKEGIPIATLSVGPRDSIGTSDQKTATSLSAIEASWEVYSNSWFVSRTTTPTTIDTLPAVIKKAVWKPTAPQGFAGSWYDQTQKDWYVDRGNNTYLFVISKWSNEDINYENTFNQIVSTLRINK